MGAFQGELRNFAVPELGAAAIRAAVERAKVRPEEIDEVIMGCVFPAGQGQAPARQASLGAGLPLATGCTQANRTRRLRAGRRMLASCMSNSE
jgi:acetyl-CoA C-acetyltransferase